MKLTQLCAVGKSGTACLYWKSSVFYFLVAILLHVGREFGRGIRSSPEEGEPFVHLRLSVFAYAA
jgi:hypothetical protein